MKASLSFLLALLLTVSALAQRPIRFYIGSLTPGPTSLISLCTLDPKTGAITRLDTFNQCKGPGYLALSPDQRHLYAATQSHELAAFAVDAQGRLTYLNSQAVEGTNPCHVSVHPGGKLAFVANYTSGSFTALPLGPDGRVQPAAFTEPYTGEGPSKPRQDKPHAHCSLSTPNGNYLYVTDLGTDRIMNYTVDARSGKVSANPAQASFSVHAGAGPRHLVAHPSGRFVYVLNELDATLTTLAVGKDGVLSPLDRVPTLPASFSGNNTAAAIRLHPNGNFLYVSNRGYNGLTAFRIQPGGKLTQVDTQTEQISMPRDFNIDPSGRYLIVANMDQDNLTVYQLDPSTGRMRFQGRSLSVSRPTCIVFLEKD